MKFVQFSGRLVQIIIPVHHLCRTLSLTFLTYLFTLKFAFLQPTTQPTLPAGEGKGPYKDEELDPRANKPRPMR